MRTVAQGYSVADNVLQRYADTRKDDATGLNHTLWRKLETKSGRWTTPDPYGGKPLPFPTGTSGDLFENSTYWDTALKNACFP